MHTCNNHSIVLHMYLISIIIILVSSFIDFVQYIFTLPEVKVHCLAFLSQNLCQDPLECFFGCQRQRGGTSDNPTIAQFYDNTQALRVINNFCRGPVRGNCRGTQARKTVKDVTALHFKDERDRARKHRYSMVLYL